MSYARQKFWEAVNGLVGDGPIEKRLASAGMHLNRLTQDDIPQESRAEFGEIMNLLTRYAAERRGEGKLHASARNLSSEEATALAEKVFHVHTDLHGII